MSYAGAAGKYAFDPEDEKLFARFTRMADFEWLDAELEGMGRKPTAGQVEEILDAFSEGVAGDEDIYSARLYLMQAAIRKVMGADYLEI